MRTRRLLPLALFLTAATVLFAPSCVHAQDDGRFDDVEITTLRVTDGLYMLRGAGGNLGFYAGGPESEGPFLIDDQFAPLTPKIQAAIDAITDRPVRFVLNTHWHPDHTGGNEHFGEAGALLVAHENVRERLSTGDFHELFQRDFPAVSPGALPVVTFTENMVFHLGDAERGMRLRVEHVPRAHTDGDAIVFFEASGDGDEVRAVHLGDLYFAGGYPLIDIATGGSIDGVIDGLEHVLDRIDDETPVIPGHGPLSTGADLRAYHVMLRSVRRRVQDLIDDDRSLEEVLAAAPTDRFDAKYDAYRSPEAFVTVLYRDLTGGIEQQQQRENE